MDQLLYLILFVIPKNVFWRKYEFSLVSQNLLNDLTNFNIISRGFLQFTKVKQGTIITNKPCNITMRKKYENGS